MVSVLLVAIALEHLAFLVLEMFFWTKPLGMKVFGTTPAVAEASAVLAANQGLYNGFLAAGLIWSVLAPAPFRTELQIFFLACVLVAGVFGGFTASRGILVVQALPALIALGIVGFQAWSRAT